MIVHLVLYRPKPNLDEAARRAFSLALERAVASIPSISRFRIGRCVRHGTGYDAAMREEFEYVALFEFADETALRAYLEHPAHTQLGELFYSCSAAALAYDYDVVEGDAVQPALHTWADLDRQLPNL